MMTSDDMLWHLQAFQFNKSCDKSFLELGSWSDRCQRPPVELAACQFAQVQRPRCLRQRVGERVDGRLAGLPKSSRFDGTWRHGCSAVCVVGDLLRFIDAAALRSVSRLHM